MRGKVPDERQEGGAEAAAHAASRERARLEGLGAQEIGGAHVKHLAHACDARSIEAQWLVECRRFLPSRKGGIPCGAWCRTRGGRAVRWRRREQRAGAGTDCSGWGAGHAVERTENM